MKRQSLPQFFRHVGGRLIGDRAHGLGGSSVFEKNPSISAKISKNIPITVLFLSKISLYEGFLLFLPQNKEEI